MNTFYKDLERGRIGEELIQTYFTQHGIEIKDVSNDEEYQKQDIDIISADGTTYEIKTDYRYSDTGNLAIEDSIYYTESRTEIKSWLWKSKADKFLFVNPYNNHCFLSIGRKKLQYLCTHERLRKGRCNDGYKEVFLYLIPPREYQEIFEQHILNN